MKLRKPLKKSGGFLQKFALIRLLLIVIGIATFFMIPALIMALALGEEARAFILPMGIMAILVLPVMFLFRTGPLRLSPREGFLLVFLTWVFLSFLGALPYYLSPCNISFTDAVFESACAFATTGATTFDDIEALPRSLLLWRSLSYWFSGMGIILLSGALMPLFGIGCFQLIKAETPGLEKEKLSPRITDTAKFLWFAYLILTFTLALLYRLGGMEWFDAVCHGLSIVATGGVSTKNSGLAFYNSPFIDGVSTLFMLLAALNFNMYYRLFRGKFRDILQNTEGRVYAGIFIVAAGIITCTLVPVYGSFREALRHASYQAASILSTTGNAAADYETWPLLAQGILFCLMLVGGCSGSTAGGIKVIRHVVLFKQAGNEIRRVLYPQGVFSIRLNKKVGRKDVVYSVAGFIFLYMLVAAVTTLITAVSGVELFSAFSASLSILGNMGLGFGAVGPSHNYGGFANHIKWLFSLVMIAGRLELWTVFVLFTPEYWRR
ncbi:MAG: TrkH family potassium uptake protein [Treponema sp.]|jgi:trk system potassium uptake protein TrkH|nr:TrkH family potassium uptake protein [Treponema sp.]